MSRLDDELRVAFKREEPSADFAARVLARIAEAENRKPAPTLWQRFREFFSPAVMPWAVATAALLLITAVAFIQFQSRFTKQEGAIARSNENQRLFSTSEAVATVKEKTMPKVMPESEKQPMQTVSHRIIKRRIQPRLPHEPTKSRAPEGEIAMTRKSKGELARDQLYKALAITSELLQEAKEIALTGGR